MELVAVAHKNCIPMSRSMSELPGYEQPEAPESSCLVNDGL